MEPLFVVELFSWMSVRGVVLIVAPIMFLLALVGLFRLPLIQYGLFEVTLLVLVATSVITVAVGNNIYRENKRIGFEEVAKLERLEAGLYERQERYFAEAVAGFESNDGFISFAEYWVLEDYAKVNTPKQCAHWKD